MGSVWLKNVYCPLERLGAALLCPEERLMAMFTAYFDASGNAREQPYVIVSGYLANYGQWLKFDQLWRKIHDRFGALLPFHMADFVASITQPKYKEQSNARADYVAMASDPDKAEAFLRDLSSVQATHVHCGISCIVEMDVYKGVSSLLDLREVVPPYALGARMCIERIRQWQEYFLMPDPVECIFEAGDFEQGKFTQLMIDEGQDAPIYRKKIDFPGLQGADHYAWEQYNALNKLKQLQGHFQAGETFSFLISAIPKRHTKPDTAFLIKLCERKGIDPRTGISK